jgi:hypothetical protein
MNTHAYKKVSSDTSGPKSLIKCNLSEAAEYWLALLPSNW